MYRLIPAMISCLLMSAHFLRYGNWGLMLLWLSAPLLLMVRQRYVTVIFQLLLLFGAYLWLSVLLNYWNIRTTSGEPRLRLAMILGGVALFTAASGLVFLHSAIRERFPVTGETVIPGIVAFLLTALTLVVVQVKVTFPVILLERFLKGGGFLEVFWLACYAGWLSNKFQDPIQTRIWRPRVWGLFSFVFFFNDTATTEIYTLSLHDALPISMDCQLPPLITTSSSF